MLVKDTDRKTLKEAIIHGTSEMPFSIHHITVPVGEKLVLYVHWHTELEFLMVARGGAVFTVEEETFELHEKEAVFMNANQIHGAKALGELPCEFYALVFHPSLLFGDTQNVSFHHYVKPVLTRSLTFPAKISDESDADRGMRSLLQEIATVSHKDIYYHELFIRGKLLELWQLLYHRCTPALTLSKEYKLDRLQPVLQYINTHYTDEISLSELAAIIPLSQGQFCRSFREALGISPVTYLNKYRILKSCGLLMNSDCKISEIAGMSGFSNVSYYNRTFLSVIGCTPSDYQKQVAYRTTVR